MDVFSWSLPFVAEKVTDMLAHVVNWSEEYPDVTEPVDGSQIGERQHILRDKVKAISKMLKMYKTLRENTDLIVQLKQLTPNKALPTGVLAGGRAGIEEAITTLQRGQKSGIDNLTKGYPGAGARPTKLKKGYCILTCIGIVLVRAVALKKLVHTEKKKKYRLRGPLV
eukprot:TRINITY_DN3750_c0_g1_i1.p1 TRINITY_DN3750_c0_g1~~TRINITY_DN3750_c0_g1_i1.p1  ORF type:complete len:168 (+),score=22.97 TRINITY_DN3750_c0_g1_i1:203-706(+)